LPSRRAALRLPPAKCRDPPQCGSVSATPVPRSKARKKRGGDWNRVDFEELDVVSSVTPDQLLAIDQAIEQLAGEDPLAGDLVKLRYFTGISLQEAAAALGVSSATAYRHWAYARAWLKTTLSSESP
jgi:DNA-directed RNA polymerase specialized sigma24 family protein